MRKGRYHPSLFDLEEKKLQFLGCAHRADIRARATFGAECGINHNQAVLFRNGIGAALGDACKALDAFISNCVSHDKISFSN
jgi:hypothetical protein